MNRESLSALCFVLFLLALSACGGKNSSGGDTDSSKKQATTNPATEESPGTVAVTTAGSPFQQSDAPPEGVDGQFSYAQALTLISCGIPGFNPSPEPAVKRSINLAPGITKLNPADRIQKLDPNLVERLQKAAPAASPPPLVELDLEAAASARIRKISPEVFEVFSKISPLPGTTPQVTVGKNPEPATWLQICFPGFSGKKELRVEITAPDGLKTENVIYPNEFIFVPILEWLIVPGDPLGTYKVNATQGTVKAGGSFTVVPATEPRLLTLPSTSSIPGGTFRVAFAGFPANSEVGVYLYRNEGGLWTFQTTMPQARMDQRGEAVYEVRTVREDPPGGYCLVPATAAANPSCKPSEFVIAGRGSSPSG